MYEIMKIWSRSACGNLRGSLVHSISKASTLGSALTIMSRWICITLLFGCAAACAAASARSSRSSSPSPATPTEDDEDEDASWSMSSSVSLLLPVAPAAAPASPMGACTRYHIPQRSSRSMLVRM